VRAWARVSKALDSLPHLRAAVEAGEVPWSVAGKVVAFATAETDLACLASVQGRSLRAVEALVAAVRAAEGRAEGADAQEEGAREAYVSVRIPCPKELALQWAAACELARRIAGQPLPTWQCAEAIAAECAAGCGSGDAITVPALPARREAARVHALAAHEHGLCERRWPHLSWKPGASRPRVSVLALAQELDRVAPLEIDRRLRAATAFLQSVDLELGRILKQVLDRKLYRELGFEGFDRYVNERLDLAPTTARRLVKLARAESTRPAIATAFREGRITALQADLLLRGGELALAEQVTRRRLEDEVLPREVAFRGPPEGAALFLALHQRLGLEGLLGHALHTWLALGRATAKGHEDFARDGWRCVVPGCTARANLQSHHLEFLSHGGPDEPWNRATLCAFHHLRGVHLRRIRITGRAPDGLVFELAIGRYRSGDVKMEDLKMTG
jgi:hypothetical protein